MSEQGFRGVPGVPDGWELVRIGVVHHGEWRLMDDGSIRQWLTVEPSIGWAVILRKIATPAKYRQFANAEEFKPHRDRWVRHKDDTPDAAFRVLEYRDSGVMNISGEPMYFADAFSELFFDDDGTPFGVRIDE
jgi:hypothetical protein